MKRICFTPEKDGFYGAFWACKDKSCAAMIMMLGDDPQDHMAKSCVKWLRKQGINVLSMSPGKKDYGHHNYPLERVETAVTWLKSQGISRIGIVGASTTGTLALTAASYFREISLTIAMTPSDFIWQGFMQGKRDGCGEWPVEGESLFSYRGDPLPYMPFAYKHPEYWKLIKSESKRNGDVLNSLKLFNDSEAAHPITEAETIKVENIRGRLLLIGARDDSLWDTARYIDRIKDRLEQRPHECTTEFALYEHGTHFIFPESLLTTMLPVIGGSVVRFAFRSAGAFSAECRQTRRDVDKRIRTAIGDWKTDPEYPF